MQKLKNMHSSFFVDFQNPLNNPLEELKNELPVKDLEKIKNLSVLIQDNIGITALKRIGTNGKHYFKQIKKKYNYRRSS